MSKAVNPGSFRGAAFARAEGTRDPMAIVEELQKTVLEYRATHVEEIKGIKKKFEDVVTTDKLARLETGISELQAVHDENSKALAALKVGNTSDSPNAKATAHSEAFMEYFRYGNLNSIIDLQVKGLIETSSSPDGGYLVPEETETAIDRVLGTVSSMRGLARVIRTTGDTYKKLVNMGGATSNWVVEKEARPETSTPTLREIAIVLGEQYAMPAITMRSLQLSGIDVAGWLSTEVATLFAEQEGSAFINGDGVKKPRGILQYDTVANGSYAWGKLGFVVTGAAAGFAATNPADALISLFFALKAGYRMGATWLISDAVMGAVRQFKDGDGTYLWQPPSGIDKPSTILGKPIETDDNMPALGANAFPVAFGNFMRSYLIVDGTGINVLRDEYTDKPNVLFYTTKMVGSGVVNFEALKLLKCSI